MPISSSLVGSVYIPLSQQQADKAKLARWPIVHLLALGPTTKKDLRAKVNDCSDQDFEAIFDRVSDLNEISGKYELRQRFFKELDVWVFKYDSSEDRQRAIDNAIKIYDKMRLGLSEPEWDRLLVRAERGTGKHLSKIQANLGPSRWRPNGAEGNA
jgi:RNA polymerase II elongation factor ELL